SSRWNRRNTSSNRATWKYTDPNNDLPNRSVFQCVPPETPAFRLNIDSGRQTTHCSGERPKSRACEAGSGYQWSKNFNGFARVEAADFARDGQSETNPRDQDEHRPKLKPA